MAHDQPTYASVPGIRVFGMMCVKPGVAAKRKPPPTQAPKLENPYYQHQYNTKNDQSFTAASGPSSTYHQQQQQQGYHQNPYQLNYQYLHRTPDVSSANRPNSVPTQVTQHHQYDDVYGRTKDIDIPISEVVPQSTQQPQQPQQQQQQQEPSTSSTSPTSTSVAPPQQQQVQNRNKRNFDEVRRSDYYNLKLSSK